MDPMSGCDTPTLVITLEHCSTKNSYTTEMTFLDLHSLCFIMFIKLFKISLKVLVFLFHRVMGSTVLNPEIKNSHNPDIIISVR